MLKTMLWLKAFSALVVAAKLAVAQTDATIAVANKPERIFLMGIISPLK